MYSPFSTNQMLGFGNFMVGTIRTRIQAGLNANDDPAKPLAARYAMQKTRKGLLAGRDWTWRGRTLRSMNVLSVNENRVVIGFVDAQSDMVAHVNNQREKAFGVSPNDRRAMVPYLRAMLQQARVISVRKVA